MRSSSRFEKMPPTGSMQIRDIELRTFEGNTVPPANSDAVVFVHKSAQMVRCIDDMISHLAPRRIVEIGIFQGGSAIYWENRFALDRLILIDIVPTVPPLERYLQRHRLDQVRVHFGVSQDDAAALRRIIHQDLGGESIDVVIDDASHQYAETLASFECLFPLIRPGGAYIIEDWSWGHAISWKPEWWAERPLLSPLITEIMLTCARGDTDAIDRIDIASAYAVVWRGLGKIGDDFRLKDHYFARDFALP